MKKILCTVLCLAFLFTLAACGKKKDEGTLVAYKDDEGNVVTEYVTTTKSSSNSDKKDINEKVEITIPLVLVGDEYQDDLDAYCEANGFISCKLNKKDQTVKIQMKSLTYDLNLAKIGTSIMRNIGDIVDSDNYPYAIELESYSDNFDEIVMIVDGEGYKADNQSSLLPYSLGEYGMFYQIYTTQNEYECTVKLKDEKSGEIIFEKTYKSDNKGTEY